MVETRFRRRAARRQPRCSPLARTQRNAFASIALRQNARHRRAKASRGANDGAVAHESPTRAAIDFALVDVADPRPGLARKDNGASVIPDEVARARSASAVGNVGLAEDHQPVLRLAVRSDQLARAAGCCTNLPPRRLLLLGCPHRSHDAHDLFCAHRCLRHAHRARLALVTRIKRVRPAALPIKRRKQHAPGERGVSVRRKHRLTPAQERKTRTPVLLVHKPLGSIDRVEYPHVLHVRRAPVESPCRNQPSNLRIAPVKAPLAQQCAAVGLGRWLPSDRVLILFCHHRNAPERALKFRKNEDLQRHVDCRHDRTVGLLHDRLWRQCAPRGTGEIGGVVHDVGGEIKAVEIDAAHVRRGYQRGPDAARMRHERGTNAAWGRDDRRCLRLRCQCGR